MAITIHWNIITAPEEEQDGQYHVLYRGVFAPRTACGTIHRGGKTWHEEDEVNALPPCEACIVAIQPDPTPEPEDEPAV